MKEVVFIQWMVKKENRFHYQSSNMSDSKSFLYTMKQVTDGLLFVNFNDFLTLYVNYSRDLTLLNISPSFFIPKKK